MKKEDGQAWRTSNLFKLCTEHESGVRLQYISRQYDTKALA